MYGNNGNTYPQGTTNNSLWFGNNYSSGYSQASRSPMGNPMMNPNPMMQGMQGMQPMQQMQNTPNAQGMSPQMQNPQSMNNIIQVMGPESAVNYATGPNSHILMSDINRPVIYDKKSDDVGYSETKAFALTEIPLFEDSTNAQQPMNQVPIDMSMYATKADLEDLKKFVEDLVMNHE